MTAKHTVSILFVLLEVLALSSKAGDDAPWIVHAASTPSGYTVAITGGGFDPATVEVIVTLPGPATGQREEAAEWIRRQALTWDGKAPPLPDSPPLGDESKKAVTKVLKPVHASEHTVFAGLPAHPWPPGCATVIAWLRDGEKLSRPFLFNRIDAWNLLRPASCPGEVNRINGFHLRGDPYATNHVFLKAPDGAVRELEKVARHSADSFSPDYTVSFRLPEDVAPGKGYRVFVHSNSGEIYGFSRFLPLEIAAKPKQEPAFVNVAERGVAGDSRTDQFPALQAILDETGEAGGGIVFLPPGSYRIGGMLQLGNDTVLRGAGRENTILFHDADLDPEKRPPRWFVSARGVNRTGIEELTVRAGPGKEYAVSYYADGEPTCDTHLLRCRFEDGTVGIAHNIRMEIADCVFVRSRFHASRLEDSWVHDNEFSMGRLRGNPVVLWGTERCTIEHNRVHTSDRGFVWQTHSGIGHFHNFIGSNVVEGTRMSGNAGETYLFEGSGFIWHGQPSEIRADGLSAAGQKWEPGKLEKHFAVVVQGRGTGQFARIASNTEDSITLEKPWPVPPAGDVRISILRGTVQNVIVNNRHVDCDNSMMFYGCGAIDNRIIRNLSENTLGISLWSHADAKKGELIPDYFNVFDSNVCEDQGGFWLTKMGSLVQPAGLRNVANVFRLNFLSDVCRKRENQYHPTWENTQGECRPEAAAFWMDIGRTYEKVEPSHPVWNDTLIERNYITRTGRGVEIGPANAGTVVRRNTFFDVREPVIDRGAGSLVEENALPAEPEEPESGKPQTSEKKP